MAVVVYLLGSIDDRYSIPVLLSPFVMILFMFFLLLNPFRVFYFTSRRWLLRVLVTSCHFNEFKHILFRF